MIRKSLLYQEAQIAISHISYIWKLWNEVPSPQTTDFASERTLKIG